MSIDTPTALAKENFAPQRVEFLPIPQFHSPRALSRVRSSPSTQQPKGILKPSRSTLPDLPSSSPVSMDQVVVGDVDYLLSPLQCILRSITQDTQDTQDSDSDAPTPADLTEAYTLLLSRLKHARDLLPSALEPLRTHSTALLIALQRDIAVVLQSPYDPSSTRGSDDPSSEPSSTPAKKRGVSESEILHARALLHLSHAALKLSAVLFLQPGVHALFTTQEQQDLVRSVLSLPEAGALPTPNGRKTNQVALWALGNLRLPDSAVFPHREALARVLECGLRGELGARATSVGGSGEAVRTQAYDTLTTLLTHYPSLLPSFTPLLDLLLPALLLPKREKPAQALLAFSLSLKKYRAHCTSLHASDLKHRETVESHLLTWLRSTRHSPSPSGTTSQKTVDLLEHSLRASLLSSEQTLVLPLIAALIHLSGPQVLASSALKALMTVLQAALKVKPLAPQWARCWAVLIWGVGEGEVRGLWAPSSPAISFSTSTPVAPAQAGAKLPPREKIEKMVLQALPALLKASARAEAAEVWQALVWAGVGVGGVGGGKGRWRDVAGLVQKGGVGVLEGVLGPAWGEEEEGEEGEELQGDPDGEEEPAQPNDKPHHPSKPSHPLESLLSEELLTPPSPTKSPPYTPFQPPPWWPGLQVADVYPLADLWFSGLSAPIPPEERDVSARRVLPLLAHKPGGRQLMFVRILNSSLQELAAKTEEEWRARATDFLGFILPQRMGKCFLPNPGRELVSLLLQQVIPDLPIWKLPVLVYLLTSPALGWKTDTLELIVHSVAGRIPDARGRPGSGEWKACIPPVLQLWIPRLERGINVQDASVIRILLSWIRESNDQNQDQNQNQDQDQNQNQNQNQNQEQWRRILRAVGPLALPNGLALQDMPFVLQCERGDTLKGPLLDMLAVVMRDVYDSDDEKKFDAGMEVLSSLLGAVQRLAASGEKADMDMETDTDTDTDTVYVVCRVYAAVGSWICDKDTLFEDEQYNTLSAALYTACLDLLTPFPQGKVDQSTLDQLAPFLASAFYRMPDPGIAPQRFASFWRATFHGHEFRWPEELKPALRWFAEHDTAFAPGLELDLTQTQDTAASSIPMSVLSDSEPERAQQRLRLTMDNSGSELMSGILSMGEQRGKKVGFGSSSYIDPATLGSGPKTGLSPASRERGSLVSTKPVVRFELSALAAAEGDEPPLRETQEASSDSAEEIPQPQGTSEVVSTATVMRAFDAPLIPPAMMDRTERVPPPTPSMLVLTPSVLDPAPTPSSEPASVDTLTRTDTSLEISHVSETQLPDRRIETDDSVTDIQGAQVTRLLSTPRSNNKPAPSPASPSEEEDDEDEAVIEFSLSQELEDPMKVPELDDEKELDDVFLVPPLSLGKRKRTLSEHTMDARKKRKTPSSVSRLATKGDTSLSDVRSSTSSLSKTSPEVSIQDVEDTFIRDAGNVISASQPTISSSPEVIVARSLSQPPARPAGETRKRKRVFLESVEIPIISKRRRLTSSESTSKDSGRRRRRDDESFQASGTPSTPSHMTQSQRSEASSPASPSLAAGGSQFWRGVRYAFSRVAGQKTEDLSQQFVGSSQQDEDQIVHPPRGSSVAEERVKTLRELLKGLKEDVKHVDMKLIDEVQISLIDALGYVSKRRKADRAK
ncbi:hypothetical protein DACRYDRAFT_110708 [Dacryopinax primogenitus]|uniref:Telomere-associated protein Rif1 N-terminal domain-containing protein n=1 Tax=Dacryopinax primogenitus (strain DJM 731) TaxID=1858805 RepID=M5FTR0_DACPD|nr:uncharacterized protein DACRYDRAFT_110708 [Dacryopinax primogenitus]EJT98819.1 hypothetical protein DACRYDRAFT_110708 [Dacryopinax primogenitus]